MPIPILTTIGLITKVASKLLSGKPKEAIDTAITEIVATDKEIQEKIKEENQFILNYEGTAKDVPRVVNVLRAIVRPYIVITSWTTIIAFIWLNRPIPDKLWYITLALTGVYYVARSWEKKMGF